MFWICLLLYYVLGWFHVELWVCFVLILLTCYLNMFHDNIIHFVPVYIAVK